MSSSHALKFPFLFFSINFIADFLGNRIINHMKLFLLNIGLFKLEKKFTLIKM